MKSSPKIMQLVRRLGVSLTILLAAILILLRGFELYNTAIPYQKHFQKKAGERTRVEVAMYEKNNKTITYIDIGREDAPILLLIHGAPGNVRTWSQFVETGITDKYRLLIPDRSGYGRSNPRLPEPRLRAQADLLLPLLDVGSGKATLISHSYGGPIATIMTILAPAKIEHNLLISSVSDPESEPVFSISHLIKHRPLTVILPPSIHSSNVEKLAHKQELRGMEPLRHHLSIPTTIFHGEKDRIAPIDSVSYMQERISNAPVRVIQHLTESHFTPFQHPEMIVELIAFDSSK